MKNLFLILGVVLSFSNNALALELTPGRVSSGSVSVSSLESKVDQLQLIITTAINEINDKVVSNTEAINNINIQLTDIKNQLSNTVVAAPEMAGCNSTVITWNNGSNFPASCTSTVGALTHGAIATLVTGAVGNSSGGTATVQCYDGSVGIISAVCNPD